MDISKAASATALSNPAEQGGKVGQAGNGPAGGKFADVLAHGGAGGPGVQQAGAPPPFSAPILDPGMGPARSNAVGRHRPSVEVVGEKAGTRPGGFGAPVDPSQNGANAGWKERLATDTSKAESKMDAMIEAARKGKNFSASELLAIQVEVFRYSQTVEVISRSTDKLVGAVKQTLGTQV
jgi:hypothetical protein